MSSPATDRTSAAPILRRYLLQLVVGVVVLDVVAVALHRWLGVDGWPAQRRMLFTLAWTAATLGVVGVMLSKIRATRLRTRRARRRGP